MELILLATIVGIGFFFSLSALVISVFNYIKLRVEQGSTTSIPMMNGDSNIDDIAKSIFESTDIGVGRKADQKQNVSQLSPEDLV